MSFNEETQRNYEQSIHRRQPYVSAATTRRCYYWLTLGLLLFLACDSSNPVVPALPMVTTGTVTIFLEANPKVVIAGSSEGSRIAVPVVDDATGQAPSNGQEVTLSLSQGSFGSTSEGEPIQLLRLPLVDGRAQTTFLAAPDDLGAVTLLASFSTTVSRLHLEIIEF